MRNIIFILLLSFILSIKAQTFTDWLVEGYSTAQGVKWLSYHQEGNRAFIQLLDADMNRRSSFEIELEVGTRLRYCYFLYDTYLNNDNLFEIGVSIEDREGNNNLIIYNEVGFLIKELKGILSVNLWPPTGIVNSPNLKKSDVKLQVTEFVNGIPIHNLYPLPLSDKDVSVSVERGGIITLYPDTAQQVSLPLPANMPIGESSLYIFNDEKKLINQYPVKRGKRVFQVDADLFDSTRIYYYDVAGIRNGFAVKEVAEDMRE